MNLELLSIFTFFGLLAAWVFFDRKNIEFGLVLIRRTKKGKKSIKRIADKHKKFFKIFSGVGILIAIILSLFGFFYLTKGTAVRLILPKVFPGEVSEGVSKVAIFMPIWYWVIGIFIVIVPHELFHGFLFALENIKIKSVGFLLFLIFPGGFVEPDEKQFKNTGPVKRMRVAVVGSMANICVSILLILLSGLILRGFYEEAGMYILPLSNVSYPVNKVNMTGVITEINGNDVNNLQDFEKIIENKKPGDKLDIQTLNNSYQVELIEHPQKAGKGFLGVSIIRENLLTKIKGNPIIHYQIKGFNLLSKKVIEWFSGLVEWVGLISISVAIANLLPFLPFDGGVMWQAIFEKLTRNKELSKKMIIGLSIITYAVLILSFVNLGSVLKLLGLG